LAQFAIHGMQSCNLVFPLDSKYGSTQFYQRGMGTREPEPRLVNAPLHGTISANERAKRAAELHELLLSKNKGYGAQLAQVRTRAKQGLLQDTRQLRAHTQSLKSMQEKLEHEMGERMAQHVREDMQRTASKRSNSHTIARRRREEEASFRQWKQSMQQRVKEMEAINPVNEYQQQALQEKQEEFGKRVAQQSREYWASLQQIKRRQAVNKDAGRVQSVAMDDVIEIKKNQGLAELRARWWSHNDFVEQVEERHDKTALEQRRQMVAVEKERQEALRANKVDVGKSMRDRAATFSDFKKSVDEKLSSRPKELRGLAGYTPVLQKDI